MISFVVGRGMGHLGRCISISEKLHQRHLPIQVFAFQETHGYLSENLQNHVPLKTYTSRNFEDGKQTELLIHDWRPEVTRFRSERKVDLKTKIVTLYHSDFLIRRNDSSPMREFKNRIREIANQSDIFLHMNLFPPEQSNPRMNCIYIPVPLITREISQSPEEVKRKLGLQDNESFILVHMGGGLGMHRYEQIVKWYEQINTLAGRYRFVVAGQLQEEDYQFDIRIIKAPIFPNGKNLVQAASLVISKPGMGILGDCISTGTPLLFLPADDAEREQKINMLRKILNSELGTIKEPEEIVTKIEQALVKKHEIQKKFNQIPTNGAEVASKILEMAYRIPQSKLPKKREDLLRLTPFSSYGNED
jgi:spore coat polysaccharide biosynthesis predicted glycosyltransferase SpsG